MAWLCLFLSILTVRINPHVMIVNQAVRVTCLVEHRAVNRCLVMSVEGYRTSVWELEGESAPGVFEVLYEHVPCDTDTISCTLVEVTGKTTRAALPIQISGCEDR